MKLVAVLLAFIAPILAGLGPRAAFGATYTLTVSVTGSGTVSRNPTNSFYPGGATIGLTAIPASDWFFVRWSGDGSGTANPLYVTMTSNKVIQAIFEPIPTYSVNLTTNGLGIITLSPVGGTYPSNSTVRVQAIPAPGWIFQAWSGDASGSMNPLTLAIDANKHVAASFAQAPAISMEPESVTASLGHDVSLNVTAVGTQPLHYQWSFNGVPIDGATRPSLVLSNVQVTAAGRYAVVVSNVAGTVTSREASLRIANTCSGSNVIAECTETALRIAIVQGGWAKFCCNGTITLSETITISNDVVLDATDFSVAISGNNARRLFSIHPGSSLYLTNLWLVNGTDRRTNSGSGDGPQIGEGGAILNNGGVVCLISCRLTNNQAVGGGSGNPGGAAPSRGGAVANRNGRLFLESIWAAGNSAVSQGAGHAAAGGFLFSEGGVVLVRNSVLQSNVASAGSGGLAQGGAIYVASGVIDLVDSTLAANRAAGGKGISTIPFYQVLIASGLGSGGAVFLAGGTASVFRTTLVANEARGGEDVGSSGPAQAGGIYSMGTLTVSQSLFASNCATAGVGYRAGNDAQAGALLSAGTTVVNQTTFSHNAVLGATSGCLRGVVWPGGGAYGGAVVNQGVLVLTNSTLALNRAQSGGSPECSFPFGGRGSPGPAFGGGLFSRTGSVYLVNVTLASNVVLGGAPFTSEVRGANIFNDHGTVTLFNSIVAGASENGLGVFMDAGYNISSDGSVHLGSGASFSFTDPLLGPLRYNGGLTPTMELLPGSPAIDFGGSGGAPPIDQRGVIRPGGSGIDIGAFEVPPFDRPFAPPLKIRRAGQTVVLSFETQPGRSYDLESSSTLIGWRALELIGPWPTNVLVIRTYPALNPRLNFFRLAER